MTLEKFIRASTRLQSEAIAAFNANQASGDMLGASNMLRKRYGACALMLVSVSVCVCVCVCVYVCV